MIDNKMKSTYNKYIDIDSTYRDRSKFSNPMNFDVDIWDNAIDISEMSNPHCFYIELTHLILPNKTLTSGGTIRDYPYVYVRLSSLHDLRTNTMLSNNPNAILCNFKVPIDNVFTTGSTKWITLNSCGMVQTIFFKPENFSFSVFLPDGTLVKTVTNDTVDLAADPNPDLQASATFHIVLQ